MQVDPKHGRPWGLLKRRECWTLTWKGRALVLAITLTAILLLVRGIHPFLAVNAPLGARYLVVEGWVPDYAIAEAMQRFKAGGYDRILTTGGPLESGYRLDPDDTYAHLSATKLEAFGMDDDNLSVVPAERTGRDRTYTSALAVRKWIGQSGRTVDAIDVVTLSVHARRTRLLYAKALAGHTAIGVVAIRDREYDPRCWLRYSEGVKEVVGEGLAYLYARFLFHPRPPAGTAGETMDR